MQNNTIKRNLVKRHEERPVNYEETKPERWPSAPQSSCECCTEQDEDNETRDDTDNLDKNLIEHSTLNLQN